MAVREFLPLKQLTKEILQEYKFETEKINFYTHSTIFEDNPISSAAVVTSLLMST